MCPSFKTFPSKSISGTFCQKLPRHEPILAILTPRTIYMHHRETSQLQTDITSQGPPVVRLSMNPLIPPGITVAGNSRYCTTGTNSVMARQPKLLQYYKHTTRTHICHMNTFNNYCSLVYFFKLKSPFVRVLRFMSPTYPSWRHFSRGFHVFLSVTSSTTTFLRKYLSASVENAIVFIRIILLFACVCY